MNRLINILAAGLVAFMLNAAFENTRPMEAQTLFGEHAVIEGWDGMIAFFTTASCPTDWTEYTDARGRMIVGNPAMGTLAGTVGTALTNQQDLRGGTSHSHSVSYSGPTVSYSRPTVNVDAGGITHINPTVNYTRPTVSVSHDHTHGYHDRTFSTSGSNRVLDGGGNYAALDLTRTSEGSSAAPSVSVTGGGVTLSGGTYALESSAVSLSGGSVTISGGSVSESDAGGNPNPAPYIQLTACQYDPA